MALWLKLWQRISKDAHNGLNIVWCYIVLLSFDLHVFEVVGVVSSVFLMGKRSTKYI